MSGKKDFKYLLARLERDGHKVERANGGHWRVKHSDGKGMVHTSYSPGDRRAYQNFVGELRRSGFSV